MGEELFPIPNSGRVKIVPRHVDAFDVECTGLNMADNHQLMGFFKLMGGRLREFRFDHSGVVHPKCRFDSDRVDFVANGPETHSVTFPIKVLR